VLIASLLADVQPGIDTYAPVLNLGAVGVICVALFIFAKATVADLRSQRDAAQEDARRRTRIVELEREVANLQAQLAAVQEDLVDLNREARTQMVPALVAATAAQARVVHILDTMARGGPT
jgi:dihydrodipicolinate synthase/N-acetylneuraminate lyase